MKKILLILPVVLLCIILFSTSCHQGYACNCMLKDTSLVMMNSYSITANNQSAAQSQCADVQTAHPLDTCHVVILKD